MKHNFYIFDLIGRLCSYPFIFFIRVYQLCISPLLGKRCRFYPSCSQYAIECLNKYFFPKAIFKIVIRLLKCHPFHPGGVDLP